MKLHKRLRILTGLTCVATVATIPLSACNNKNETITNLEQLTWNKQTKFKCTTVDQVKDQIKQDNKAIFTDWDNVEFNVTLNSRDLEIVIDTKNSKTYTGTIGWKATLIEDINKYNFVKTTKFASNDVEFIKAQIIADNIANFIAWEYVDLQIKVNHTDVQITINTANSKYFYNNITWNAIGIIDISQLLWNKTTKFKAGYTQTDVINQIKKDNANLGLNWDDLQMNIVFVNNQVDIAVTTENSNAYTGSVVWPLSYVAIDLNNFNWIKTTKFLTNDAEQIKKQIKKDNEALNLDWDALDFDVIVNACNSINVSINSENYLKYENNISWTAYVVEDIATFNWIIQDEYLNMDGDDIKAAISEDNETLNLVVDDLDFNISHSTYETNINISSKNESNKYVGQFNKKLDKNLTIDQNQNVYDFINERTFAGLCGLTYGTFWLMEHVTDSNKTDNNYTYYAMTNLHVSSTYTLQKVVAIKNQEPLTTSNIRFAYQNKEDIVNGNKIYSIGAANWDSESKGKFYNGYSGKYWNQLDYYYDSLGNFKSPVDVLFSRYLTTSDGENTYPIFEDMAIVKFDFSEFANTRVGFGRLDRLNAYADKHNGKLVEFEDFSNIGDWNNITLYCGGVPFTNLGSTYDFWDTEFMTVEENSRFEACWYNNDSIIHNLNRQAQYGPWLEFGKKVYTPDLQVYDDPGFDGDLIRGNNYYDKYNKFGGGTSGSMAIIASDPNDVNTFKVAALRNMKNGATNYYRGYQPTSYFCNRDLSLGFETSFVKAFYNSIAFKNEIPYVELFYQHLKTN